MLSNIASCISATSHNTCLRLSDSTQLQSGDYAKQVRTRNENIYFIFPETFEIALKIHAKNKTALFSAKASRKQKKTCFGKTLAIKVKLASNIRKGLGKSLAIK